MAKADTSRIEALEAVLAEKRKHEGYLAKLEDRRATTPANVFARLRDDVMHWRGWWRNSVTRVFLVFFLTSFGTSIGVWIAIGINTGRMAAN